MELTKKDKAFMQAIQANWPGEDWTIATGASPGMACCGTEDLDRDDQETLQDYDEGSFSWESCDSCGSGLGGSRHKAHAIHREAFGPDAKQPDNVIHIEICVDCLIWHANGELPVD